VNFRDGFLHTDELKMALRARNVSGAFEKRAQATPEKFKNATINGHFGFEFQRKTRLRKSPYYRDVIVFGKLRFQNVYCRRENETPAFSNSFAWKRVFESCVFVTD